MVAYADPQTKKHVGITCDLCGSVYRDKFIYYSAKIDMIEVDSSIQKTGVINIDRRFLDLDYCSACFEKIKQQVLSAKPKEGDDSWTTSTKK